MSNMEMSVSKSSKMAFASFPMAIVLWVLPFASSTAIAKEHHSYMKQNKSFFFPKFRPEIFYDNKVLPEDIEVDAYIFKGQLQRLFYVLDSGYRPLSITVTPCSSSPIEWRLSHQPLPAASTATALYQSDLWYNHIIHPQPLMSSPSAAYTGTERRSYTNPKAPPGLYILELDSTINTRVKVVVTTRSCSDYSYHPPLPTVQAVQLVKAKRNRVLISWKPSATNKPVEYCVTSNTARNYNSLCSANPDMLSEQSTALPSGSGFGFQWEKAAKKVIQSNFVTDVPKNNLSLICIGRKTWHMFKKLERGKTYYFDVFAIDTETNASTAYIGVNALIKNSSKLQWIKDDSLMTFTLDNSNSYITNAKYHGGKATGAVLIFVQSCKGPGPVVLSIMQNSANGKMREVLSERIMDVKTLEIPHQKASANGSFPYTVSIRTTNKIMRKVRIWISAKKQSFPFPVLPSDKNVKVFDTLITCNSITIGWKASPDEKVKYCIYRSAVRDDLMRKTLGKPQNFCEQPIDTSSTRTTVLCRRYHRFSKRRFNNVIMQRVRGLELNTTYLFEVEVTKMKGKMLPYEQVWASTRKMCTYPRNNR